MNASVNLDELFPTIPFDAAASVKPVPWLVEGLWQAGKFNALFGFEKAGKSRFLRWVVLHLLLGRPLFNCLSVQPVERILWLAGEEVPNDITAGMLRQAGFLGVAPRTLQLSERLHFVSAAGMRLELPRYREWIEGKLSSGQYQLLIMDPLRRLHGANENDNTAMSVLFNDMRKWSNQYGATELLVHHTGHAKNEADWDRIATWARGATDLAAIVDTAVFLERQHKHTILRRQGRYAPLPNLYLVDGNEQEFVFKLKEGCRSGERG